MLQVYEGAYRLYVVTYKICQMLQSWNKLLSSSPSTETELLYDQAESDCGPLPLGSAVNLNKLNLIEIELFIKMRYGVWSSLQPDHETNKSPRRMQVSSPARNDDKSPIWNILRSLISFLFRG